ncbi:hypothetical protein VVD49_15865 [Uliginosibacterium sp. H3]|uniref:Glycosyltransferase n=1 Tax=Uliginosibacterium silvisoli TaxID=3114758 RepID=A0ABU6K6Z9_9RHOO|nr:hypothetical protein [Uliginosibacterium sp. H3]
MDLVNRIGNRLRRDFFGSLYRRQVRGILDTPPVQRGDRDFIQLSMVHTRDVLPYLAAAKSFARYAAPRRIVVVCDPSITAEDRATLVQHIPFIELLEAADFRHADIPQGGTWERLFAIANLASDNYVVQVDADTLTLDTPHDVITAIDAGNGFVIGEEIGQGTISFEQARTRMQPWIHLHDAHVQVLSETALPDLGLPPSSRYVGGCSGFTGFPPSQTMREDMLEFSRRMTAHLGKHWTRWGTEQVTSNYLVANTRGFAVLPFPRYATPDVSTTATIFKHYIGHQRFRSSAYVKDTRDFLRSYAAS